MKTRLPLHPQPGRNFGAAFRFLWAVFGCLAWAALPARAVTITNVTVVNVTPTSFSVLWRAAAATPSIAVFADAAGTTNLAGQLGVSAFPLHTGNPALTNAYDRRLAAAVTRQKTANAGLNLMRVTGCQPGTTYFFRLTSTPAAGAPAVYPASGPLPGVTTENENTFILNSQQLVLDLVGADTEGFIVLLSSTNSAHPLAAVVGDGVNTNQVFFNVSDLFALGGGGNYAIPGPQPFFADVLGPAGTDQQRLVSLTFTTQLTVAQTTELGVISEYVTLALGSAVLRAGQTSGVPVTFDSTAGIGRLDFLVDIPPDRLTNLTLQTLAPQIDGGAVSITPQGGSTSLVHIVTLPGQFLIGGQQIAQLTFLAVTQQTSAFVPLRFLAATAAKPDGSPVNVPAVQSGRVVVIGSQPLLEVNPDTNGLRSATLYAQPWMSYALQMSSNLVQWVEVNHFPETNQVSTLRLPGTGNQFYRIQLFTPDPPVLEAMLTGGSARQLLFYGRPGTNYTLQSATSLSPTTSWLPFASYTLTNSFHYVSLPNTNAIIFHRLRRN